MLPYVVRSSIAVQFRTIHTTPRIFTGVQQQQPSPPTHTPDSYSKDVDFTPPSDPTIHRVDAASESVHKPHEPPSGEYSHAEIKQREYKSEEQKKA
jgi:hypothetical protein